MRAVGALMVAVGVLLGVGAAMIGLPFTGVYLMGFIGTSGREAGGELAMIGGLTLAALGIALALVRAGLALRRQAVSAHGRSRTRS